MPRVNERDDSALRAKGLERGGEKSLFATSVMRDEKSEGVMSWALKQVWARAIGMGVIVIVAIVAREAREANLNCIVRLVSCCVCILGMTWDEV